MLGINDQLFAETEQRRAAEDRVRELEAAIREHRDSWDENYRHRDPRRLRHDFKLWAILNDGVVEGLAKTKPPPTCANEGDVLDL